MKTNVKVRTPAPRTHEGAISRRIDAESQLRRTVMSCLLFEGTFYEDGQSIADRIKDGVSKVSLEEAASIALEARERMHLRHVPLWVVREMARVHKGHKVGDTLYWVIQRPDELAEFLALYWKDGRRPLSAQVKRGLAMAFGKFGAHQLAKYNRDGAVKLRDVLFLTHAKPKDDEQEATWKALVEGTLTVNKEGAALGVEATWENRLSAGEDPKTVWTDMIERQSLGGLAMLRNLRNMKQVGVSDADIRRGIAQNPFKRVLPFRFISAAKYAPDFEPELEQAMFRSLAGMPKLPGKTVLLIDHSGSMENKVSEKSEITRFDAASAIAMMLREIADEVSVYTFSSDCRKVPPRRGFALRDAIKERVNPTSTLLGSAKRFIDAQETYDRIIVLTDEQSHDRPTDPPPGKGYIVNVAPYRNGIGYGPWIQIDGWSEQILKYIMAIESLPTEMEQEEEQE